MTNLIDYDIIINVIDFVYKQYGEVFMDIGEKCKKFYIKDGKVSIYNFVNREKLKNHNTDLIKMKHVGMFVKNKMAEYNLPEYETIKYILTNNVWEEMV